MFNFVPTISRFLMAATSLLLTLIVIFVGLPAVTPSFAVEAAPAGVPVPAMVSAPSAADFDAGYIVSDENFYDGFALDAAGVQAVLLSKNSRCTSSFACLYNYRQATPSMEASAYCAAMPAAANESAASIIVRVGVACGISQRTMIVLLEKEQGLVSSSRPTQRAFEAATGFGCPDTAGCDPSYGGFFYQVYNAARQFKVYRAFPSSFNYRANTTNNILYSPNASCGRSAVFIRNAATAALYAYTPYQPNAAAMANLYGSGDVCSAYGNRNFWRLWSDWFGSPVGEGDTLIRVAGTTKTYLVSGGLRYAFSSAELLAQYSSFGPVQEVSAALFNSRWVDGSPMQRAVRLTDGSVHLVDNNRSYRFRDCAQVADYGMDCNTLPTISPTLARKAPSGGNLTSIVQLTGGRWFMQGGQRREIPDPRVLAPYGVPVTTVSLTNGSIGSLPIGAPVLAAGVFTNGIGSYRAVTGGGTFEIQAAALAGALPSRAQAIETNSFNLVPATGPLPFRITSADRSFVAVDGGFLEVDEDSYGEVDLFTRLPFGTVSGLPIVATELTPHFIRERSTSQYFLVSWGYRRAITGRVERDWIAATYGVPQKIWLAADGALASVPTEPVGLDERAVRLVDGTGFLIDANRRYKFSGCVQAADFGFSCSSLPTISLTKASRAPLAGSLASVVQVPDGTKWFLQGGQRRETPNPAVLAPYGIPVTTSALSLEAISALPVGPPVLSPGLFRDGVSRYRVVTQGGTYDVQAAALEGSLGGRATMLKTSSFDALPATAVLPFRVFTAGRALIAVDGGFLVVDGGAYGGTGLFSPLPDGALSGLQVVGTRLTPHFIRERSASQLYLVSGGHRATVANTAARDWISQTFGVPTQVWLAADGALASIPVG